MNENNYSAELNFFINFSHHLNLPHHLLEIDSASITSSDMELREMLGISSQASQSWKPHLAHILKPNTITYVTDEFFCQYVILLLPDTSNSILTIGPYITSAITIEQLLDIMQKKSVPAEWLPILKNYYQRITCLSSEDGLVAALHTLASVLWGTENYTSESFIQGLPNSLEPLAIPTNPQKRADAFASIRSIEQIYQAENELLQAVSHGRSAKAKLLLSHFPVFSLEQRTDTLRNLQNYTIVINTLLRKAAEQGGVHPIYIDQLSSTFAYRIESTTRTDYFSDLWNDMIQKYCALVNKHSVRNYSLPIQKVITRIDFDLTADLSLKGTAQHLNMNASYLSNLFKTETGYTLTDYVNMKRMDYAAYLLINTTTPVSNIAQSRGILDDNYFTKLFKRYHQKTPSQFRQEHYSVRKS